MAARKALPKDTLKTVRLLTPQQEESLRRLSAAFGTIGPKLFPPSAIAGTPEHRDATLRLMQEVRRAVEARRAPNLNGREHIAYEVLYRLLVRRAWRKKRSHSGRSEQNPHPIGSKGRLTLRLIEPILLRYGVRHVDDVIDVGTLGLKGAPLETLLPLAGFVYLQQRAGESSDRVAVRRARKDFADVIRLLLSFNDLCELYLLTDAVAFLINNLARIYEKGALYMDHRDQEAAISRMLDLLPLERDSVDVGRLMPTVEGDAEDGDAGDHDEDDQSGRAVSDVRRFIARRRTSPDFDQEFLSFLDSLRDKLTGTVISSARAWNTIMRTLQRLKDDAQSFGKAQKAVMSLLEERSGEPEFSKRTMIYWREGARVFMGNAWGAYETGVFYEGDVPYVKRAARTAAPKDTSVEGQRDGTAENVPSVAPADAVQRDPTAAMLDGDHGLDVVLPAEVAAAVTRPSSV